MTWKAGDSVSLPVFFETNAGVAQVYANAAAFTGAGGAFTWYQAAAALGLQPTYTLTPQGATGWHFLGFALPTGVDSILITYPANIRSDPAAFVEVVGSADIDSLASTFNSAAGTPVSADRVSQYDWDITEGDTFLKEMVVPSSALADFGLTTLADLSGGAWTVAAMGRTQAHNPLSQPTPDFTMIAVVSDKVNNKIKIEIPAGLAGVAVDYVNGDNTIFQYDAQLLGPLLIAITAVNTGTKTFTVAGDQRLYFRDAATFTITGSTGNNGSYIIATSGVAYNGTSTTIIVTATPASAIADGSINTTIKLSPIRGKITCKRQETTSP